MTPRGEPPLEPMNARVLPPECPKCGGPSAQDVAGYFCEDDECGWVPGDPEPERDEDDYPEWGDR